MTTVEIITVAVVLWITILWRISVGDADQLRLENERLRLRLEYAKRNMHDNVVPFRHSERHRR
jgi:hypothetical protein